MNIDKTERRQVVSITLRDDEWQRFEAELAKHYSIKTRWVADAIREKLNREGGDEDAE